MAENIASRAPVTGRHGADAHAGYPRGRTAWYAASVLLFVSILSYADRGAMILLATPIQKDLGLSDTQVGLLLGPAFILLYIFASLPLGYLADRRSRRNILTAGLAIWSISTAACGYADSFAQLFIFRMGVGLGEASLIPCAYSMVSDYFPPEKRGRAMAMVALGVGLGTGLALFGGGGLLEFAQTLIAQGWLQDMQPWQFVFLFCGALGIVGMALLLTVREPKRMESLSFGDGVDASGLVPFLRQNSRALTAIIGTFVLGSFLLAATSSWFPTLLIRNHQMPEADVGYATGLVVLAVVPASTILGGYLADLMIRYHANGRLLLVMVATPSLMPSLALAVLATDLMPALVGMALCYLFSGIVVTIAYATIQDVTPNMLRGRILAGYQMAANLIGVSMGAPSVALVNDHVMGETGTLGLSLLIVCSPVAILGTLFAVGGLRGYRRLRATLANTSGGLRTASPSGFMPDIMGVAPCETSGRRS